MKSKNKKCLLVPPGAQICPLQQPEVATRGRAEPQVVIVRTERRSWITLAITGFGALLVRYLKTVRERGQTTKNK